MFLLLPIAYAAPAPVHLKYVSAVEVFELDGPDRPALVREDDDRAFEGLPERFADPRNVFVTPDTDGAWEELKSGDWMWQLRVAAEGAAHLNFGFTSYWMPDGGTLQISASDGTVEIARAFTSADNKDHGELWTPVLVSDDVVIEVVVPAASVHELELELTTIGVGYRGFGADGDEKSGWCNADVACEEGDDWWDEIPSVAVMGMGASTFCTGFMINNTAQDETPYFQTAQHCGLSSRNASSLITYWNYQASSCGQGSGRFNQFNTGATFLVDGGRSDFSLVELDERPDPAYEVTYAGWDNTGDGASTAVGIHHPSTDEKAISISYSGAELTGYYSYSSGDRSHVMVSSWDVGTTEGGSSGSPLFNQDHQVIGQLHGGYASCGNSSADWYGSFATSWDAGLDDYLDPDGRGNSTLDTLVPWAVGLEVLPESGWALQGAFGGPFTPSSMNWELTNDGDDAVEWEASIDASWVMLSSLGGRVSAGGSTELVAELGMAAASLATGLYTAVLTIEVGDDVETRAIELQVGEREEMWSWDMEEDPGWDADGGWAWGIPGGNRAPEGLPDPSSGATGDHVFGYELDGGYDAMMDEQHLVVGPLDMSGMAGVTLTFERWLGVEGPPYDFASLSVSLDGDDYEPLWVSDAVVDDGDWARMEYDLSAIVDDEAEVWIRWTMGVTDQDVEYCGWNIDDVVITALVAGNSGASASGVDAEEAGCGCAAGGGGGWLVLFGAMGLVRRRR